MKPEQGIDYAKPITLVRESVEIVRTLLRDGSVQYTDETVTIENFDLWFSPKHRDIPLYLAGFFQKMKASGIETKVTPAEYHTIKCNSEKVFERCF